MAACLLPQSNAVLSQYLLIVIILTYVLLLPIYIFPTSREFTCPISRASILIHLHSQDVLNINEGGLHIWMTPQ